MKRKKAKFKEYNSTLKKVGEVINSQEVVDGIIEQIGNSQHESPEL